MSDLDLLTDLTPSPAADPPPADPTPPPRRGRGGAKKTAAARRSTSRPKPPPKAEPSTSTTSTASTPTNKGGRPSQLDLTIHAMAAGYEMIGKALEGSYPITSAALVDGADDLAGSWKAWAETSPRVRRFLESAGQTAGVGTVVAAHVRILFCVQLDRTMRAALAETPAPADSQTADASWQTPA